MNLKQIFFIIFVFQNLTFRITVSESCQRPVVRLKNCTCGVSTTSLRRLVGGSLASEAEFPWQAAIYHEGKLHCGGSLVNDRYIITAAHCFKTVEFHTDVLKIIPLDNITIILGTVFLPDLKKLDVVRDTLQVKRPQYVRLHPLYDPHNFNNDIALIKLIEPVQEFTDEIQPICLAPPGMNFQDMVSAVSGWGAISDRGGSVRALRKTSVKVLSRIECKNKLSKYFHEESMLCAASPGHDACYGDSGGALVSNFSGSTYYQIGVVSYGIGCGDMNFPGVYTKLNRFVYWIRKNTQDAFYCGF